MKYLIYDVNRGRSNSVKLNIYINMARLVHDLGSNWTLVLPPCEFILIISFDNLTLITFYFILKHEN